MNIPDPVQQGNKQGTIDSSSGQKTRDDVVSKSSDRFVGGSGLGGKEYEAGSINQKEYGIVDRSKEVELPKEVQQAGVVSRSQQPQISKKLQDIGVTSVEGTPVDYTTGNALPLSQSEIIQGNSKSIKDSWKWLAQWCKRQLEMIQNTLMQT